MTSSNSSTDGRSSKGRVILRSTFIQLCLFVVFFCLYLSQTSRERDVGWKGNSLFFKTLRPAGSPSNSSKPIEPPHADWRQGVIRQYSKEAEGPTLGPRVTPLPSTSAPCKPVQKVVYVKTHKTASTTTASILERFGYLRNLSFAMSARSHIISSERVFKTSMAYQIPNRTRHDFDMLVNHVRYNRPEMDKSVPNATYISIIRDPVSQLESAFGYFEMGKSLKILSPNPFETFMSNPKYYYSKKAYFWSRSRNGQLFDFGFDHAYDEDKDKIQELIDRLSREIDLMLVTEFFDESLILLKKLMCWDYDDILYISNGIRSKSHRYTVTDEMARKIRAWSAGDVMLYEHFNRTFWKKVAEYGPQFQSDLAHFRELEQNATELCVSQVKNDTRDRREEKLTLKSESKYCQDLLRADVPYTALIRKSMVQRANEEAAARLA